MPEALYRGEFDVTDIKIAGYVQIINTNQDADKFFKAKVSFVTLDETTGKEKKTSELYLVQSDTLESAESDVKSFLNDSNTAISSISETVVLEVFQLD